MQTAKEIIKQFEIWVKWTLTLLGVAFIGCIIATFYGWPTPFKTIEKMEIESRFEDISYAMMAAQEDILELHKKVKK